MVRLTVLAVAAPPAEPAAGVPGGSQAEPSPSRAPFPLLALAAVAAAAAALVMRSARSRRT